ncbi:MAG: hypothetical protein QM778_18275 [Myxococcales bacterium]
MLAVPMLSPSRMRRFSLAFALALALSMPARAEAPDATSTAVKTVAALPLAAVTAFGVTAFSAVAIDDHNGLFWSMGAIVLGAGTLVTAGIVDGVGRGYDDKGAFGAALGGAALGGFVGSALVAGALKLYHRPEKQRKRLEGMAPYLAVIAIAGSMVGASVGFHNLSARRAEDGSGPNGAGASMPLSLAFTGSF